MHRRVPSPFARSATVTSSSYKFSTVHTTSRASCRSTLGPRRAGAWHSSTRLPRSGGSFRTHPEKSCGSDCDPCGGCCVSRANRQNGRVRGAHVWPLRATSSLVLLVGLLATGVASWGPHAVVHDQEERLLKGRVNELNLLLTNSLQAIQSTLSAQGGILKATNGSASAFEQAAAPVVAADPSKPTLAWLRKTPSGYLVVAAAGDGLQRGEALAGERAQAF